MAKYRGSEANYEQKNSYYWYILTYILFSDQMRWL